MADDQSKVCEPDHNGDAGHDYQVRYLTEWYGISEAQALALIASVGNDAQKLDEAAEKLRA